MISYGQRPSPVTYGSPPHVRRSPSAWRIPSIPKRPTDRQALLGSSCELSSPSLGAAAPDSIGLVAGFGGLAAVIGGKFLSPPISTISTILGYTAIGFAAYRLLVSPSAPEADLTSPGLPVTNPPVPISDANLYRGVAGAFLSPLPGTVVVAVGAFRTSYAARILLSNPSPNNSVDVIYQVVSREVPKYLPLPFGLLSWTGDPKVGQVAQGQVNLKANDQKMIDLTLDPVTTGSSFADVTTELTLQKKRTAGSPWETLGTVTFMYNRSGG